MGRSPRKLHSLAAARASHVLAVLTHLIYSPIHKLRAHAHLFDVQIPMLFLQGSRDNLASLDQLEPLCKKLGGPATLNLFANADHSFRVPARTGRQDAQVLAEMIDAFAAWLEGALAPS